MKFIKYIFLVFLVGLMPSCKENLSDLNIDPDSSPTARPQEVLTAGMGYYTIALEGYFNEANAVLAQYWAGGPGVALLDIERYFIEPGDYNTEWSYSYYQSLSDLDFVIDNGNASRKGVAQILSACIYQTLVDHYGDIPFSEALRGALEDGSILTPNYDDDAAVYTAILSLVDEGLANIALGEDIGAEDLMYGGDLGKWEKFGNSLKLKMLMRQSISDASVGTAVKTLIDNGTFISSEDEMASIEFIGDVGNWNPQYARREQGIGMFYIASNASVERMQELNDPRLSVIYDAAAATGTIVGVDQGNIQDIGAVADADFSYPSDVCYGAGNACILMSHWEVMFLRAEADMRFGTADDETMMFNNAILAHFDYIGADGGADYIATEVVYNSGDTEKIKSGLIGIQKWISFNGLQESEGWIESRRFDTPDNKIFTDAGTGIFQTPTRTVLGNATFPSIRLYPQSELSFNPNAPAGRTLTEKVFWDN